MADDHAAIRRPRIARAPWRLAVPRIGAAAIVAVAAALLIPLLSGWQLVRARDATVADARQSARTLVHALAQHATRTVEGVDLVLSGVADRMSGGADPGTLRDWLTRRAAALSRFHTIVVAGPDGLPVADTAPPHGPIDLSDRPYFAWHRDHPEAALHIDPLVPGKVDGRPIIPLSRRLEDGQGAFAGVVVAGLLPEDFQQVYAGLDVGPNGTVALWTEDGRLLVRRPAAPPAPRPPDPARPGIASRFATAQAGVECLTSRFDGVERIIAFEHLSGYPLVMTTGLATRDVLARWRHDAMLQSAAVALTSLALVVLAFALERQRRSAARQAARSREADARYRLLSDRSSDMVSHLGLDGVRRYVSPASEEIMGRASEALLGTRPPDFIHPDEAGRVEGFLRRLGAGEVDQARSMHRVRHGLGHWVWVEAQFRLVRDPESGAPREIVSSLRDMTARHALERQVQAGADLLRATLESMEQGLVVLSPARDIRICNPRAAELLGLPAGVGAEGGPPPDPPTVPDWLLAEGASRREHAVPGGPCLEVRRVDMPDGGLLLTLSDIGYLKAAERRVSAANRLMRMAEEVAHVGHWHVALPDNALTWSEEVYRIHGVPVAAEPPPMDEAVAFYHPDDRVEVIRSLGEAVARRGSFEFTLRLVRPDGEVRHVLSRGRCETDERTGDACGVFGVIVDLTELARAQRDLGAVTAHLRATLDNMDQGLVTVEAGGAIALSNRRFAELLDLPPHLAEGPGRTFGAVLKHFEAVGEFAGADSAFRAFLMREDASQVIGSYERRRPNGRTLEVRTVPLTDGAVIKTYTDVTSRRQAEDAMRQSEAQYRMLADSTSDVITQLDLDFRCVYASPACRAVLGYEPDEMVGRPSSSLVHPDDAAAARAAGRRLIAGGFPGDRTEVTCRFPHKAGHAIWIEAALNLLRDPATGAPSSVICSLRDVSARQRAARHLERAKAAAESAARLKSEFVANISHELRTPLTGILGIHDLLHADPRLDDEQRRYVGLAHAAGRSLLTIVNDVLDFSKIEAGELALEAVGFDLDELVRGCADLAREQARGKPLAVEARTSGAPSALLGDPTRLRQVLLNLLSNAVKFTERGAVSIEAVYDGAMGRLRVEVADTGIGIPAEAVPRVFDRFSQADASTTRRFGGTGLGLAICRHLVELMGGDIAVRSEVGRGTAFRFEVPLAPAAAAPTPPRAAGRAADGPLRRVLLAEDNDINQDIISAMLARRGHAVVAVGDGAAAVAAVAAGPRFAVVLMDLQMPVMDGLAAARAIRAAEAAAGAAPTPILGLTANAMAEDVARCREAGMDGHVAKPIDWAALFGEIDRVAGQDAAAAPAPDGPERGDVLDPATLAALSDVIGADALGRLLAGFVADLDRRLSGFEAASTPEMASRAHALMSVAGQLGFHELFRICAEVEAEARDGRRPARGGEVAVAAARAIDAARAYGCADAA